MPDSPHCPNCLEKKVLSHTYKVAGKQQYRCNVCHKTFSAAQFDEEAFLWKDNPERYEKWEERKRNPQKKYK